MLTARMRVVSDQRADQTSGDSSCSAMLPSGFCPSWFRVSAFIGKTIPRAIEGGDRIEFGIDLAEFAAQALDVAVDRAVVDIDVVLIGGVHQLVAAAHDAGARGERFADQIGRASWREIVCQYG